MPSLVLSFVSLLLVADAMRKRVWPFVSFDISGSNPVELSLIPVEASGSSITVDLTFRLDSTSGNNFYLLQFDSAGVKQDGLTLEPASFPSACALSSSFEANKWYQISVSATAGSEIKYALDLATQCTALSGWPSSSLEPLKLFFRDTGTAAPAKITVANLKIIRQSIDYLVGTSELSATNAEVRQITYLSSLFEIPFITDYVPPIRVHNQVNLSTLGTDVSSSVSTVMTPTQKSYFRTGTTASGLLQWNSNPQFTDWYDNMPTTLETWIYMDSTAGYTFSGGEYMFHLQLSAAMRVKDASGEIGCSHQSDNDPTFSSFTSHFPSFVQFDTWNHLACIFRTTGISFAYN